MAGHAARSVDRVADRVRPRSYRDKLLLFAESENRFYLDVATPRISFTRDPSGEVDAMILLQGGKEQVYPRVE
jgi:hypothetical protein